MVSPLVGGKKEGKEGRKEMSIIKKKLGNLENIVYVVENYVCNITW